MQINLKFLNTTKYSIKSKLVMKVKLFKKENDLKKN